MIYHMLQLAIYAFLVPIWSHSPEVSVEHAVVLFQEMAKERNTLVYYIDCSEGTYRAFGN